MDGFEVVADARRRRILELLASEELTAGEITAVVRREFSVSQPAVSQHLRVLRDAGFITDRRDGARRIYRLEPTALAHIDEWLNRFRQRWAQPLDALATEIARGKKVRARQPSAPARPARSRRTS